MKFLEFFIKPAVLWNLLWILPFLVLAALYASSRRKRVSQALLGARAEDPAFNNLSKAKRNLNYFLVSIGLLFALIAAARPFWGSQILPWSGSGRDVMFVLDLSKSMLAEDIKPSRIEHSKWLIKEIVKSIPGDRYGLVGFSGSAFLQCPMTIDKTSLFQILDELRPGSIPLGGTNIENALNVALKAFSAAEGSHKAIVLLTDGDELQGKMSDAVMELKEKNIPIYVIGVGDPSQPGLIMNVDEETGKKVFMKTKEGELVKSSLNEQALAAIASEDPGSIYVRTTATNPNLEPVLAKIRGLVPEKYQSGQNTKPIERFHLPLFVAVILLMLSMCFSETRRIAAALLVLSFFFSPLSSFANAPAEDDDPQVPAISPSDAGEQKQPPSDSAVAMPGSEKDPEKNAETCFSDALKLHEKKDYQGASQLYQKTINLSQNPELRSKSFQNLGAIVHGQAREMMQGMDIEKAEKTLAHAEEMYKDSISFADAGNKSPAINQQLLINDRKILEELKKKKEEMEKKRQEAKDKTEQAKDKNQEEKEQKSSDKNKDGKKDDKKDQKQDQKQEQKQDSQSKDSKAGDKDKKPDQEQNNEQKEGAQDQKQDTGGKDEKSGQSQKGEGQEKKEEKDKSAQEKTEEAKKAVDDYKKEAEKQNSEQDKEKASKAKEELEKAAKAQEEKKLDKADEHLKKALESLAKKNDEKKDGEKEKNGKKDKGEEKDKKKEPPQEKSAGQGQAAEKGKGEKDEKIDQDQAEALLDLMEKDEKNFRDELKELNRRNSQIKEVEKDW